MNLNVCSLILATGVAAAAQGQVDWQTQIRFSNRVGTTENVLAGNTLTLTATGVYTFTVQVGVFDVTGLGSGQANYGLHAWTGTATSTGLAAGESLGVVRTNARVSPFVFGPATAFAGTITGGGSGIANITAARDVSGGATAPWDWDTNAGAPGPQPTLPTNPSPGSATFTNVWRFQVNVNTLAGSNIVVSFAGQAGPVIQWATFGTNPPDEVTPGNVSFLGLFPNPDMRDYSPTTLTLVRSCEAPALTGQPTSLSACAGGTASFAVAASGAPSLAFQWRRNGSDIPGATSTTLAISAVGPADAAVYDCVVSNPCGATTSNPASLTVNAGPVITIQPVAQSTCSGGSASFTVAASGSPSPAYQWRKNSVNIPGATSASLTINSVAVSDFGSYDCVVTNSCGSATSSPATLTVNTPPDITTQPLSQVACLNSQVTFTVTATGSPDPIFQWRKNSVNIPGATGNSYTINAVGAADVAGYDCLLGNTCGLAVSSVATLNIDTDAPTITTQPVSSVCLSGQAATFSVATSGGGPLAYLWRRNGVALNDGGNISGATSATLTINPAAPGDTGSYNVVISNVCNSTTSTTATLTVDQCPTDWTARLATGPGPRWIHAMAFDVLHASTVLFGGRDQAGTLLSDTWGWDGHQWSQLTISGPLPRSDHAMAYDRLGKRVVLFGGRASTGPALATLGDTWGWDGVQWTRRLVTGPPARGGHGMAYDENRGRVVLFGGFDQTGAVLGDTWEWDGSNWSQRSTTGPAARYAHGMALDPVSGRVMLFGGGNNVVTLGDTWEWNGAAWAQVASSGPAPRAYCVMASDSARQRVVLSGGLVFGQVPQSDTWEWNGISWAQVPSTGVSPRWGSALVFDPIRARPVMYGGSDAGATRLSDTWERNSVVLIATQPQNVNGSVGQTITLTVVPSGPGPFTHQWSKDGITLSNGGRISGANTATLTIGPAQSNDSGIYSDTLSDPCGTVDSAPVTVAIACRVDLDQDGLIEPADVALFISRWFASLQQGTLNGDFDQNGVVQPADVGAFISAWSASLGGNCPP